MKPRRVETSEELTGKGTRKHWNRKRAFIPPQRNFVVVSTPETIPCNIIPSLLDSITYNVSPGAVYISDLFCMPSILASVVLQSLLQCTFVHISCWVMITVSG